MGSELPSDVLDRLLPFVNEPRGRASCKTWSDRLLHTLQLEHRIRFHKVLRRHGTLGFHHAAVRTFGDDFAECVVYQFEFHASGRYDLTWSSCSRSWSRGSSAWSLTNERQVGLWEVSGERVQCRSTEGPLAGEGTALIAPAGRCFGIPVALILGGRLEADSQRTLLWEYGLRGTQPPGAETTAPAPNIGEGAAAEAAADWDRARAADESRRFVEVDGELHEVAGDIKERCPEAEWQRLMRCRVRFGPWNRAA